MCMHSCCPRTHVMCLWTHRIIVISRARHVPTGASDKEYARERTKTRMHLHIRVVCFLLSCHETIFAFVGLLKKPKRSSSLLGSVVAEKVIRCPTSASAIALGMVPHTRSSGEFPCYETRCGSGNQAQRWCSCDQPRRLPNCCQYVSRILRLSYRIQALVR